MGTEPAKRLHKTPDHPKKQAPPLQSRSLGVRTPIPAARGSGPVRQSSNSIQILAIETRVEIHVGVRKVKTRESKCKMKFDTKTELGANLSFATSYTWRARWMPEAGFMRADLYRSGLRVNASRRCDGCQRSGLQGRTPNRSGPHADSILLQRKIFISLLCLSVKLTQMLYIPWVG